MAKKASLTNLLLILIIAGLTLSVLAAIKTQTKTATITGKATTQNQQAIPTKIIDDPNFEVFFTKNERNTETLLLEFYHDSTQPQPVWIEQLEPTTYTLSKQIAQPYEKISLKIQLKDNKIPRFRLHIGTESEVLEFQEEENTTQTSQTIDQQPTFSTQTDNQTTSTQEFGAAITLSSCGVISSPGSYALTQNVSSSGTCFNIQTSNVELDCQGFTINYGTSTAGNGINASAGTALSNITIRNCNIQKGSTIGDYNWGIRFRSTSNSLIFNNTISTDGPQFNYGILFDTNSNSNIVSSNTIRTNGISSYNIGIYFVQISNSTITNNTITTNGTGYNYGIYLYIGSNFNNISSNTIRTNGTSYNYGVFLFSSIGNTISENNITTTANTSDGIRIVSSQNNTFNKNNVNVSHATSSEWKTETIGAPISLNNTAINLTLVRNNITIHLTAFNGTEVKAVTASEAASLGTPPGLTSLGKFANITNSTGDAWLFINITYTDEEVAAAGIIESTLRIWRHNGTAWTNESFFAPGQYGVDTTNNFVFANITGFSTYGVFGATGEPLSSCGVISSPGSYALTQNVSSSGTCFQIQTSNVVLDCQGFTITYGTATTGNGINASTSTALSNITIRNCNIQKGAGGGNSNYGIQFRSTSNSLIFNNTISTKGNQANYGIYFNTNSNSNNISNNRISTYGTSIENTGIVLSQSSLTIITNNNITTNGTAHSNYGIYVLSSNDNSISNNRIATAGGERSYGVYLNTAAKNTISSNSIATSPTGSLNYGILVWLNSNGNNISENNITTTANASHGIRIQSSQNNAFNKNNVNVSNETSSEWGTESPAGYQPSRNNTAINLTLVRNNITIHLTAFNGTEVKGVTASEAASLGTPPGLTSLGKFANITNSTGDAWLFINITYTDEEVAAAGIIESTLRIWRYNGTAWTNESFFAPGQYGVDTTNNFVFAN
ncbi:MAG: right-handed parallel beta-helix repeat-containing protein, partial [Candidatus Woesearchaeota archaeon]